MPARNERIYLYPHDVGQPGQVVPFPLWWDRRAFFDAYGSRGVDLGSPFSVDEGMLLSPVEAMAWDERSRAQFAADARSGVPVVMEEMRILAEMLPKCRWVIVESYEWESGLD